MSILKYKYKAHKLVNILFYAIVFIVGFSLGFTSNKIDFSKLLSQVLMIDSVSAYEILKDDYITITEKEVVEYFETHEDFNLNEYNRISCTTSLDSLTCSAFSKDTIFRSSVLYGEDPYKYYLVNYIGSYFIFNLEKNNTDNYYFQGVELKTGEYGRGFYNQHGKYQSYQNFNFDSSLSVSQWNDSLNVLDFSNYTVDLIFNENLFKDNPDFKEVCVPNNKDFAISTNNFEINENPDSEYYGAKHYSSYEFIWFPYYPKGLVSYLYDNSKDTNIWIPEADDTYFDLHPIYHYWLDEKEEIDRVWDLEDPGSFLNSLGYTDKYSYFGWYTHPFVVSYASAGLRQFSVFRFNENFEFYSTLENGIDYFEKLEEARNGNICFYIRKDFDVNLLNTDEFGDKYGDITIMGDEILNIQTSESFNNLDSKGLFNKIQIFIGKIFEPCQFIGKYIYNLYTSLHPLLKLFLISVFGLIVLKKIIDMVVR